MNRIGWTFLAMFALLGGLAALLVDCGGGRSVSARTPAPAAAPRTVDREGRLILPVAGARWRDIRQSWGDARSGGRAHHGVDIMASGGTPVVAAAEGVVEKLLFSRGGGGISAYVRSPDRRLSYYYAHLAGYAANLREGARVRPGDVLGYVGDTGNAGTGNYHLHFGIEELLPSERWWQGRARDPYPLLAAGRDGR